MPTLRPVSGLSGTSSLSRDKTDLWDIELREEQMTPGIVVWFLYLVLGFGFRVGRIVFGFVFECFGFGLLVFWFLVFGFLFFVVCFSFFFCLGFVISFCICVCFVFVSF